MAAPIATKREQELARRRGGEDLGVFSPSNKVGREKKKSGKKSPFSNSSPSSSHFSLSCSSFLCTHERKAPRPLSFSFRRSLSLSSSAAQLLPTARNRQRRKETLLSLSPPRAPSSFARHQTLTTASIFNSSLCSFAPCFSHRLCASPDQDAARDDGKPGPFAFSENKPRLSERSDRTMVASIDRRRRRVRSSSASFPSFAPFDPLPPTFSLPPPPQTKKKTATPNHPSAGRHRHLPGQAAADQ